jgi:DNA-binding transcriptional ArsR family regulator
VSQREPATASHSRLRLTARIGELAYQLNIFTGDTMGNTDAVFKALANRTRREILQLLRTAPRTSGEIAEQFPTAWATISRHLGVLRDAGMVRAERNGSSILSELNTTVFQDAIRQIMSWMPQGDSDERSDHEAAVTAPDRRDDRRDDRRIEPPAEGGESPDAGDAPLRRSRHG